jgi:folate-binding protein YgfZ
MPINPLQSMHEQAEASFLPYGAELQIVESYGEVEGEYAAIRKAVALMDAPHRGLVVLTGKDRLAFLNNLLTNDTKKLVPGQGVYSYLLNTKGRITMDMNVLHSEDATLLEMDARLTGSLVKQFEKFVFTEDVKFLDASGQLVRLTLLGPRAAELLNKVADAGVETLSATLNHGKRSVNRTTVTIFRNDVCGEPQYELIVPRDAVVKLWQVLQEAGNGHGEAHDSGINLRAIGWSAFNTARIEEGTPLLGIDITENYLPMETGPWYTRAVAVSKGCYLGQEIVARMHAHNSVARMFVGLRVDSQKLPMAGTELFDGNAVVGIITSSCMSPMLGYVPVATGYVKKAYATIDKEIECLAEGGRAKARVSTLPLWHKS